MIKESLVREKKELLRVTKRREMMNLKMERPTLSTESDPCEKYFIKIRTKE